MFTTKKYFFYYRKKIEFTDKESWLLLRELSALVVTLSELEKDLKWK